MLDTYTFACVCTSACVYLEKRKKSNKISFLYDTYDDTRKEW